jgi:hypothetical protein
MKPRALLLILMTLLSYPIGGTSVDLKGASDLAAFSFQEKKCGGRCIIHDSQANTHNEIRECELRRYFEWPDHCKGYFVYNLCSKQWELNKDGSKRMHWVCCVHR